MANQSTKRFCEERRSKTKEKKTAQNHRGHQDILNEKSRKSPTKAKGKPNRKNKIVKANSFIETLKKVCPLD